MPLDFEAEYAFPMMTQEVAMSRHDELTTALTTVESIRADLRAIIARVNATRLPGEHDYVWESGLLRLNDAESELDGIIDALNNDIEPPVITQPQPLLTLVVEWNRGTSAPVEGTLPVLEVMDSTPDDDFYDQDGNPVDSDPSQCEPWRSYLRNNVFPALRNAGFDVGVA